MTETTPTRGIDWASPETSSRLKARRRRQNRLKYAGMVSIGIAFLMLGILLVSIISSGYSAFVQTHVEIDVFFDPEAIDVDDLPRSNFNAVLAATMQAQFPEVEGTAELRRLTGILSDGARWTIRDLIVENPDLVGETVAVSVPVADTYDQLYKGFIDRETPEQFRRLDDAQIAYFDRLVEEGRVEATFNWALFFNADSRFPELAGLKGAIIGSFYALATCFVLSFPVGIGAAIYLEEFAPRNRFSDLIEVNINNLAAVPSVVFGLLALAVFLGWFGMPRSSPFVGGMTLALMTLPTIIIATRAALKAVPPSIREAALGVGASRHQVVFQHVLPLAMPGILTGTIIGLAQALGETAPLLLIGMNAFITSAPATPFDSSTALPTQIFIWADSPERGFVSRTSAAIMVLLGFLVMMNAVAIYLRNRFQRTW
ncbi:phosphate ABC transporter permease PstA [Roseitranquillus sediminis]|uniref:phosphate ABC transporter permease PstA n=1 Tax=Roseitranquillus sediminis TaxID=2809051 RepID=UPI001D0C899B|nr:phosphate ABC transporter permease PstA [Roseitranquillus sediminis]MBM9594242.1 phosphate ABC transporter permease PstA [Roseitranquillus sediminis]